MILDYGATKFLVKAATKHTTAYAAKYQWIFCLCFLVLRFDHILWIPSRSVCSSHLNAEHMFKVGTGLPARSPKNYKGSKVLFHIQYIGLMNTNPCDCFNLLSHQNLWYIPLRIRWQGVFERQLCVVLGWQQWLRSLTVLPENWKACTE